MRNKDCRDELFSKMLQGHREKMQHIPYHVVLKELFDAIDTLQNDMKGLRGFHDSLEKCVEAADEAEMPASERNLRRYVRASNSVMVRQMNITMCLLQTVLASSDFSKASGGNSAHSVENMFGSGFGNLFGG